MQFSSVQCWFDWPDLQNVNVFIPWIKAECDDTTSHFNLEQKVWIIFPWTKLFSQTRKGQKFAYPPGLGFYPGFWSIKCNDYIIMPLHQPLLDTRLYFQTYFKIDQLQDEVNNSIWLVELNWSLLFRESFVLITCKLDVQNKQIPIR